MSLIYNFRRKIRSRGNSENAETQRPECTEKSMNRNIWTRNSGKAFRFRLCYSFHVSLFSQVLGFRIFKDHSSPIYTGNCAASASHHLERDNWRTAKDFIEFCDIEIIADPLLLFTRIMSTLSLSDSFIKPTSRIFVNTADVISLLFIYRDVK
jgi:hypothetical protein